MGELLGHKPTDQSVEKMASSVEALFDCSLTLKEALHKVRRDLKPFTELGRGRYWETEPTLRDFKLAKEFMGSQMVRFLNEVPFSAEKPGGLYPIVSIAPEILTPGQIGVLVLPTRYHYQQKYDKTNIEKLVQVISERGNIPLTHEGEKISFDTYLLREALEGEPGVDSLFSLMARYCPDQIRSVDWCPDRAAIYTFFCWKKHLYVYRLLNDSPELEGLYYLNRLPAKTPMPFGVVPRSLLAIMSPLPSGLFWLNFPPENPYSEETAEVYRKFFTRYSRLAFFQPRNADKNPGWLAIHLPSTQGI